MSPKSLVKIALVILIIAILLPLATGHWLRTIRFRPVDMPVSLMADKVQTIDFETNLHGDYYVQFSADYEISYRVVEPCSASAGRDVRWTLYRLSADAPAKRYLWATNRNPTPDEFIFGFNGPSGKYQLQWDIPPQAACLNSGHPRLEIYTSSDIYEEADSFVCYLSLLFAGAGLVLLLRGLGGMLQRRLVGTQTLRMLPELTLRTVLPARKRNPSRLINPTTQLSVFSSVWGTTLSIVVFVNLISFQPRSYHGLFVQIHDRSSAVSQKIPWPEGMSVYIGADDRFYVNGRLVAPGELQIKLKEGLGKQMVWSVYLEADRNCTFAKVAYAMAMIQDAGANVAWITPQIRDELNRHSPGTSP
jgi:biopolymer transport protein ExbD